MHEESPALTATLRDKTGSRYSRRLRGAGKLPGVVYGHKQEPVAITLDAHDALRHISKGEKVFELKVDGGESGHVLLKALGYDHLGDNIIHADFARVSLDERVRTSAHLKFVGDAVGLKKAGAVLVKRITELELECQVANLPDVIEVDIADLDLGDAVYAKDVQLPKSTMVLLTDPDAVVARITVGGSNEDEEEATGEGAEVSADAEPAVIGEKKEEGEAKSE